MPRPIEVKAIEDCTVDGSAHRKMTPSQSGGVSNPGINARKARPNRGNRRKVQPMISACSRQCVMPAMTASRDSRAPCRKNSSAIATMAKSST